MFTYKKGKKDEDVNIDLFELHSTLEIHVMSNNDLDTTVCATCNKSFKNGDKCGIVELNGTLKPAHERCPK